jgi:hypothetical protein
VPRCFFPALTHDHAGGRRKGRIKGSTALHAGSRLADQPGRWFAEIQRRCLDRGVLCSLESLEDLTTAVQERIKLWNDPARPFKRTKTPDQIIDRICRYCTGSQDQFPRRRSRAGSSAKFELASRLGFTSKQDSS